MPGVKKINLHAIYGISEAVMERDNVKRAYFDKWLEFAKVRNLKLDFNPTFFLHSMVTDGLTLSSPHKEVIDFWIRHGKTARDVAKYIGEKQGCPCLLTFGFLTDLKIFQQTN